MLTIFSRGMSWLFLFLRKGDAVQKISVVQSLPSLIKQDSYNVLGKVLPKIQQELIHSSCEFQVTTSHVFQMLITNNLSSVDGTITAAFIQNIDSKDPIVANSWLEALLNIITLMPLKIVQTEVRNNNLTKLLHVIILLLYSNAGFAGCNSQRAVHSTSDIEKRCL